MVSGDQLMDAFGLVDGEFLDLEATLARFGITFKGILISKDGPLFVLAGTKWHLDKLRRRQCDL